MSRICDKAAYGGMMALLTEAELEALYEEWVESGAQAYEGDHYGHERAAFYAGVAAERKRTNRPTEG